MEQMPVAWFYNLGIKIYNLPREAFVIFGFPIYWYAIIITTGIIGGIIYVYLETKRTKQDTDAYMDFFFFAFILSFVGARLYYVIFSGEKYSLLRILNFREGGIAIYGAVIGAVIAAIIFTRKKKMDFWVLCDTCAPALILGQAIGRWGNFMNREVFGGFTDSLFSLRYMASQVQDIPQVVFDKMVSINGIDYIQVHPTFLYESMWNLLIFVILNIVKKHKKFDGEITLLYFMGYAVGRFFIEGIRTDQLFLFNTTIPVSQLLSAVIFVVAGAILVYRYRGSKKIAD